MLDQVPLNFVVKSKSVEIILLAVLNKKRMLFIKKKTPAESCEKTKIKEHLSIVVVNIINQSFIVKKKKKKTTKDSRTYKIKTKTVLFQIIIN